MRSVLRSLKGVGVLGACLIAALFAAEPASAYADASIAATGSITLTEVDGAKSYQLGDGEAVPYDGTLTVTTNGSDIIGTLSVASGDHAVVLNDARFANAGSGGAGISLAADTTLDVTLVGENIAHGNYMSPGIELPQGATITFNAASTGSIDCAAEDNGSAMNRGAPGIGSNGDMGTLVVNGGTVVAHASKGKTYYGNDRRSGAAIGTRFDFDSGRGGSCGDIIINGGKVVAIGKDDVPAVGAPGWFSSGTLTMTGGELDISTGGSRLSSATAENAIISGNLGGRVHNSIVDGSVQGEFTVQDGVPSPLTIPSGSTLVVPEGTQVEMGEVSVEQGGTLSVGGTATVDSLDVVGTVSIPSGSLSVGQLSFGDATSTGEKHIVVGGQGSYDASLTVSQANGSGSGTIEAYGPVTVPDDLADSVNEIPAQQLDEKLQVAVKLLQDASVDEGFVDGEGELEAHLTELLAADQELSGVDVTVARDETAARADAVTVRVTLAMDDSLGHEHSVTSDPVAITVVPHSVGDWSGDSASHWHACSVCGDRVDEGAHSFGDWTTTVEPTTEAKGEEARSCTVCGYAETRELPVLQPEPGEPEQPGGDEGQPGGGGQTGPGDEGSNAPEFSENARPGDASADEDRGAGTGPLPSTGDDALARAALLVVAGAAAVGVGVKRRAAR